MGLLQLGDIIKITDEQQGFNDIYGVVIFHSANNNEVAFRIIANDFLSKTTYMTHRNNVLNVVGKYEGKLY